MGGGFAGAKSVDARRRRRLAGVTETLPPIDVDVDLLAELLPNATAPMTSSAQSIAISFIPRQRWKIGLAGVAGALLIFALAYLADCVQRPEFPWSIAGAHLFAAETGTLPRLLQTLILFGAAQLALVIRGARKRSIYDFGGKYQCWSAVAATCGALGLLIGSDASVALAHTRFPLGPWTFDFSSPWTWQALIFGGWSFLAILIWHELKRCGESLGLFLVSAACLASSVAIAQLPGAPMATSPLVSASAIVATALGAPWSLFLSLWFHTRFVVYVSADPPEQKEKRMSTSRSPGIFSRLAGLLWPFRKKTASLDQLPLETEMTIPESLPKSAKPIEKHESAGTHDARIDDGFDDDEQPSKNGRGRRKKRRQNPDEAPIDKAMLKGLSKKERNRVRQQWRDELRTSHAGKDAA